MKNYILALDQGTTSSRCIIFDSNNKIISIAQKEFPQIFPEDGWVEHNPDDIYYSQLEVAKAAMEKANLSPSQIAAIGITNQRETVIVWNKKTGKPVYNAIVWQCRRTASFCEELRRNGSAELIRKKTGLVVDSYFSATKIKWILDNVEGTREMADRGELIFGTVDSWLIYKLSGGKINPLIGSAGVSAVPMAARVAQKVGQEEDPSNFLLMHAMGPNVAGVIGSAVAAGVFLNWLA